MRKIVSVTLHKDSADNYAVSITPTITTVAALDEDDQNVTVRWILQEPEDNPGFPNASQLIVSFSDLPTPFTIASPGQPLPATEQYQTQPNGNGASVETPIAQDRLAAGENSRLYKYTVTVKTNDGKEVVADPHVKFKRGKIGRNVWD